jgi:apolipoprotein N-acyltransferase
VLGLGSLNLSQTGKVHFGFIYGISAFGCVSIWAILNLMHGDGIDMYRICSVLGYGLVPIVLLAAINVVVDLKCVSRHAHPPLPPTLLLCLG